MRFILISEPANRDRYANNIINFLSRNTFHNFSRNTHANSSANIEKRTSNLTHFPMEIPHIFHKKKRKKEKMNHHVDCSNKYSISLHRLTKNPRDGAYRELLKPPHLDDPKPDQTLQPHNDQYRKSKKTRRNGGGGKKRKVEKFSFRKEKRRINHSLTNN